MLGNHSFEVLDATQCDHMVSLEELDQKESHGRNCIPSFSGEYLVGWDVKMEVKVEVKVEANGRLRREEIPRG